jgi:hypothetical protein
MPRIRGALRNDGTALPTWCSGGAEGTRTPDPLIANEMRYQLRHSPNALYLGVRREAKR